MSSKLLSVCFGLGVLATVVAALVSAPRASAAVPTYTGCLNRVNLIVQVAVGDAPATPPCRDAGAVIVHFSAGDLTSLTAGTGLTGGGANGDVSVALAPGFRLPQACAANQGTTWNGSAWVCASLTSQAAFDSLVSLLGTPGTINQDSNPVHWTKLKGVPAGFADGTDDVGPSYSAGFGLNLSGTTFSVDPAQVQGRVADTCAAGSSIRAIAQDGTVTCQGHSSYTAGEGLALAGNQFSVADGGVTPGKLSFDPATQDELDAHENSDDHDGRYPTRTEAGSPGTINDSSNALEWTRLKNVPAGFADGQDDGTVYSAGESLALNGSEFSVADGGVTPAKLSFDPATQSEFDSLAQLLRTPGTINQPGNPLEWSKLKGVPTGFADGTDANTTYTASGGIDLAGNDFRLSTTGCSVGEVLKYTGPSWSCEPDAVAQSTFGGLQAYCALVRAHPSSYEGAPCRARVGTLDVHGLSISTTIGSDGYPVTSYATGTFAVNVAHCEDPACATSSLHELDAHGSDTSLAIGLDGNPVVSYSTGSAVKVADCQDPACAASTTHTLGSGVQTSIAIAADGNPVVSYRDSQSGALQVAHCSDEACAGSTLQTVDTVGFDPSIAIGSDRYPVIAYQGPTGGVTVARCGDSACASSSKHTVDTFGARASMAIGTDGFPVVAYQTSGFQNTLRVAHCTDADCAGSTVHVLTTSAFDVSLAIGADGYPVMALHSGSDGSLRLVDCSDAACGAFGLDVIASFGDLASITVGTDSYPVITYVTQSGALKLLRPAISS
jgi:hypothetical protein